MNKILDILKTKKFWIELLLMTGGMIITAIAVYYFLVPSKLIIGTISGLSIVISGISEAFFGMPLPVSTVIFVINAILLVLAYLLIGKEFGIKTIYTALILGPIIGLLETYFPYQNFIQPGAATPSIMGDIWFDLCCFVLLLSASQAMLFKINASTGGLDILAKIVNKYLHFDIGASISIAGAIICCTAFAINPFHMVVIGLIGTWINGLVVDHFTAGLNMRKKINIVSKDYEKVRKYIIEELIRGCTLHEVTGGYSNEKTIELESLLTKDEFAQLMTFINDNQINAFITAGNVYEIYGYWIKDKKEIRKQVDRDKLV